MDVADEENETIENHSQVHIPQTVLTSPDDVSKRTGRVVECKIVLSTPSPSDSYTAANDASVQETEETRAECETNSKGISRYTDVSHSVRQRPLVIELDQNISSEENVHPATPPTPPPPVLPFVPPIVPSALTAIQRPLVFDESAKSEVPVVIESRPSLEDETTAIEDKLKYDDNQLPVPEEVAFRGHSSQVEKNNYLCQPNTQEYPNSKPDELLGESTSASSNPLSDKNPAKKPHTLTSELPSHKSELPSQLEQPKESKETFSFAKDATQSIKAFFGNLKHDHSDQTISDGKSGSQKDFHHTGEMKNSVSVPDTPAKAEDTNLSEQQKLKEKAHEVKASPSASSDSKHSITSFFGTKKHEIADQSDKGGLKESETKKEHSFAKDTKQNIKAFFDSFKSDSVTPKHKDDSNKMSASQPNVCKEINLTLTDCELPSSKELVSSTSKETKHGLKSILTSFKSEPNVSKHKYIEEEHLEVSSHPPVTIETVVHDLDSDSITVNDRKQPISEETHSSFAKDTRDNIKAFFDHLKHEHSNKGSSQKVPTVSEPVLHQEGTDSVTSHKSSHKHPLRRFFSSKGNEGFAVSSPSDLDAEFDSKEPLKGSKSVKLDLVPTYSVDNFEKTSSFSHLNGYDSDITSEPKERAQSVPSEIFLKNKDFSSSHADVDPVLDATHEQQRDSFRGMKKFFGSFRKKSESEKQGVDSKQSVKQAVDDSVLHTSEQQLKKQKKNKGIKRSLSDKVSREEVIQNFKGFFDSMSPKSHSKKPCKENEHIYDAVEVRPETSHTTPAISISSPSEFSGKSDDQGMDNLSTSVREKDKPKPDLDQSKRVTDKHKEVIIETETEITQDLMLPSVMKTSQVCANSKECTLDKSKKEKVNEPTHTKQDKTSVFNTIGENIMALKEKMKHGKEKTKKTEAVAVAADTSKDTTVSLSDDKFSAEIEKVQLPSPDKPVERIKSPAEIEKVQVSSPGKPVEKIKSPAQIEDVHVPSPDKPVEKIKPPVPEKPKQVKPVAKAQAQPSVIETKPFQDSSSPGSPSSLYDTCCMHIAGLLRDKAIHIVNRTYKSPPPPKPPKPSAEAIARARAAAVSRRLDALKAGRSIGESFPVGYDNLRFVDDDTESSCDYKDLENFDYILDYGLISRYKLEKQLDTFSVPSTCSGLTSYYTADNVTLSESLSDVSLSSYPKSSTRTDEPLMKLSIAKKGPPPIPPKPSIAKIKAAPGEMAAVPSVNGISLSPRLQTKFSKDPAETLKRPLMVADIKGTQFSSLPHSKTKGAPIKPLRNFNTILKHESLKNVSGVSVSIPANDESVDSSQIGLRHKASSEMNIEKRTKSPPRPPPPNLAKKLSPHRPPPPAPTARRKNQNAKLETNLTLTETTIIKDSDVVEKSNLDTKSAVSKENDSAVSSEKLPYPHESKVIDDEIVKNDDLAKQNAFESFVDQVDREKDKLNNNIPTANESADILNNNIEDTELSLNIVPKPPPRTRRIRSRTVEVIAPKREEERLKRSQSLSDVDVEKRVTFLEAQKSVIDSKSLYSAINKKDGKKHSDSKETAQSTPDLVSGRPLPAPPPPPRKFRSLERNHTRDASQSENKFEAKRQSSLSPVKPPARRKKSEKERFFSLRSENRQSESPSPHHNLQFTSSLPPKFSKNNYSLQENLNFDVNANISCHSSNSFSQNIPIDSVDCVTKTSSSSETTIEFGTKRSSSTFYYASENFDESWEVVDPHHVPSIENQDSISPKPPLRRKAEVKQKKRETSKFYVNMDEELTVLSHVDKETSPLPLDCSEKSVQTSLETLSQGIVSHDEQTSRDEQSDDTDELLSLAQTLQKELSTIINRHKVVNDDSEDTPSPPVSASEKDIPEIIKDRRKTGSVRSSTSEVWPLTSSDESEVENAGGDSENLKELALKKKRNKIFYVAQEIMTSEEVFVDALKLLNVDFKAAVEAANQQKHFPVIPDETLSQILNHLPQLLHLNDNLLMELKDRIQNWEKTEKIADVIVKMGPFLKLYSWYIHDFECNTGLLEECKRKYPAFAQTVKEFEMSPRCKRLTLNHYMLKPIQRIPQYRLLLQEYLHHLSEDSIDYQDTLTALQIVSEVANHANDSMKQGDNAQKLISIQNSIMGHKEIVKPGRVFVKEGELMKLSRKGMQPRWFILFNDLLLYLTPVQQGLFRINHDLPLTGMKVAIPIQQDYQNEFSIISVKRSFTLAAKSSEERQEWIVALTKSIEENASKRSTFTNTCLQQKAQDKTSSEDEGTFILGRKAPVWIPDARVTMCQLCTSEFTVTFRRHHCRACGKVVCSICSSSRISLQYLGHRIARVCDECHLHLGQGSSACTESGETDSENQQIAVKSHLRTDNRHQKKNKRSLPSVLKEVCANDQGSTISGYLHKKAGKSWKRDWFVVKDKVLYEYKASEDVAALRSTPLLGYQVESFNEPHESIDPSLLFQLTHLGQPPIMFYTDTVSSTERWMSALKAATVLE